MVHLTHLFYHCLWLPHFPKSLKEPSHNLTKIQQRPFLKVILKIFQRHTQEEDLLIASQFGFCTSHSTTLQYMRFMDHMTLNSKNMSMAAVFLDIKESFDTTWHPSLLYKLHKLQFATNIIKLISSFLSK
jgi:hypothetical protein